MKRSEFFDEFFATYDDMKGRGWGDIESFVQEFEKAARSVGMTSHEPMDAELVLKALKKMRTGGA